MKPTAKKRTSRFDQGYFCAVATLLHMHGDSTEARDLFKTGCPRQIDWSKIAAYDREAFTEAGYLPLKDTP